MSFDHESGVQSRLAAKHGERFNIRAAFTLVELLVVVAILSLLASLLLPGLARAQAKRKAVYCFNNLRQLGIALQIANDVIPFDAHWSYMTWGEVEKVWHFTRNFLEGEELENQLKRSRPLFEHVRDPDPHRPAPDDTHGATHRPASPRRPPAPRSRADGRAE